MVSHAGQLQLKIISAKLSVDVESFGKQDPYLTCMYLGQKHKTGVHEGGGKTPAWNHTFDLAIGDTSDEMNF